MFAVPFLYSLDSMLKTQCTTNSLKVRPFGVPVLIECIEPEKTLLCFNQTIAMIHLSIHILQGCNSHSFLSHIAMRFSPTLRRC